MTAAKQTRHCMAENRDQGESLFHSPAMIRSSEDTRGMVVKCLRESCQAKGRQKQDTIFLDVQYIAKTEILRATNIENNGALKMRIAQ